MIYLGIKPKVKDHYKSHRLSYLLNLFPLLQNQPDINEAAYYYRHHLLYDHENLKTYDGIVRQITLHLSSNQNVKTKVKPNEKVYQPDTQTICNEYFKNNINQMELKKNKK